MHMMLTSDKASLADMLRLRRRQLMVRLGAVTVITLTLGPALGWALMAGYGALYGALQLMEARWFGEQPARAEAPRARRAILALMFTNSLVFCAPVPLLVHIFGPWGQVMAVYFITATASNAVLSTIGCPAGAVALSLPPLLYATALPFMSIGDAVTPPMLVFTSLLLGGAYFTFNVTQLWLGSTRARRAEMAAVRQHMAERDAQEARLYQLTQQDTLTQLLNRDALRARLTEALRAHRPVALLLIDLDGFKFINDTLGHGAGDEVLIALAGRIRASAREHDDAARLGGDEFALLLAGVSTAAQARSAAERLIDELSQPVLIDGQTVNAGASIGIALGPLHGGEAEQLYAHADLALYQAKAEGRHCARVFSTELRDMAQGRVRRDEELRQALEEGEFEIFYQPLVRLADGALTGAEALLRWRHPRHGLLTPAKFLDALEEGMLGARVGAWVIEAACAQAVRWRATLNPDFRMAVNLFGAQFRSGTLAAWVEAALAKTALPPAALEIEITETIILRHEDDVAGPLKALRARGVGVAFDDYGTGFASLSMLTRYPVSRLKIDRSFTQLMCDNAAEAAIVRAVIRLAGELGLEVTAEGIETETQARRLAAKGCAEGQGFYFGRPMSAAAFERAFTGQAGALPART
ncbi:bifunctional diguanylate cyclase/phosphodiesterase [Acidocella sp.]|uniref:putative bifunctional diguanylate cyclase/phosphodiesterase n=2 Tax=Acidocella sp. TaxID=50710 RepID=UPI002602D4D6|nr:EAL domain-containing protein [Acidocella sp.]